LKEILELKSELMFFKNTRLVFLK